MCGARHVWREACVARGMCGARHVWREACVAQLPNDSLVVDEGGCYANALGETVVVGGDTVVVGGEPRRNARCTTVLGGKLQADTFWMRGISACAVCDGCVSRARVPVARSLSHVGFEQGCKEVEVGKL
jgi:hypothetical protein